MGYMGSYYNIPKAIFYLLKGDHKSYFVFPNLPIAALEAAPRSRRSADAERARRRRRAAYGGSFRDGKRFRVQKFRVQDLRVQDLGFRGLGFSRV